MNWKIFKVPIPKLLSMELAGWEFMIIPIVILIYIGAAFFLARARQKTHLRRIIQIASLLVFGLVFTQCLCIVKMLVWTLNNSWQQKFLLALAYLWLPALNIGFVLYFGRYFYCYCICPVGFLQDITGKCNLGKNKTLGLAFLLVLAAVMGVIGWMKHPAPFIYGAGAWLGFLLIVVSILVILYPGTKKGFRRLKYVILPAWAVLAFTAYKVPGPWCVPAQAILSYSALLSFLCVLLVSAVLPRGWCNYICPDGALLQLISKKPRSGNETDTQE